MRVTTPLADVKMTIGSLKVEGNALVMKNAESDLMRTRTVLNPQDVRKLIVAILRPSVLWFALTCLFRHDSNGASVSGQSDQHPTPNPW